MKIKNEKMKIVVYHAAEDDPKKCTAKKLEKFGLIKLEKQLGKLPSNSLLLDPFSEKALSREDAQIARNGIVAIDCSWKKIDESAFSILRRKMHSRALPFLLAANPVNYGRAFKLTTAEAIASALYILNDVNKAKEILSIFKWGPHFFVLNKEPLEEYRKAENSGEIIEKMNQFI